MSAGLNGTALPVLQPYQAALVEHRRAAYCAGYWAPLPQLAIGGDAEGGAA